MKLTYELIEKAKKVGTAEELLAMAKENGLELVQKEAETYFAKLNQSEGELSEEELDNVAGGGCNLMRKVDQNGFCDNWRCHVCSCTTAVFRETTAFRRCARTSCNIAAICATCNYKFIDSGGNYFCTL